MPCGRGRWGERARWFRRGSGNNGSPSEGGGGEKRVAGGCRDPEAPSLGPNYALAKVLQNLRAISLAASQKARVSCTVWPSAFTASVCHVKTAAQAVTGMSMVPPQRAYVPAAICPTLLLMLLGDLDRDVAQKAEHPCAVTADVSFHGGLFRTGYDVSSSTVLGAMVVANGWSKGAGAQRRASVA